MCNAGAIFDGLQSKYLPSQQLGLKVILRAVGTQAIQFLEVKEQVDSHNLPIWKLIEYESMEPKIEEIKVEEVVEEHAKKGAKKAVKKVKEEKEKKEKKPKDSKKKEGDKGS